MKELVFVRHAESEANAASVWSGRSDWSLSDEGQSQLVDLGKRLSKSKFDFVVSSSLKRARHTAESFANDVVIDDGFLEIDLGGWDGLTRDEVRAQHGEQLNQVVTDRTSAFGQSGESLSDAGNRINRAVDDLVERMPEDSTVAVVTHAGLLQTYLHQFLPGKDSRVHAFMDNTSITRIRFFRGHPRLAVFNDTGHLGPRSGQILEALESGTPVVTLIRHGRTRANVEQRWQGQRDWDLDELGYRQAEALGEYYGTWDNVYSSPLKRAHNTARHVAAGDPVVVDDLMELHMGEWEDKTMAEIEEGWPGVLEEIYRDGNDLPRGETGETWSQLTQRFRGAVEGLKHVSGVPTVVVAHGGAIRSFVSSLTATTDTFSESLFTPANTGVTHIALTERGPLILDYAVAPHIEDLDT